MARVTRPGGRVGALEFDLDTMWLDHDDQTATRAVLAAFRDSMAQPWAGRQLPQLFREAGLSGLRAQPFAVLGPYELFQALLDSVVTQLRDEHIFSAAQASQWWEWLSEQQNAGLFLGGATIFAVTGTP